ncbi:MAG: hypothetical protein M3174_02910 [Actinomycetota bacterium]|nr:hypothetical protein [Actinomycetota bacterium]
MAGRLAVGVAAGRRSTMRMLAGAARFGGPAGAVVVTFVAVGWATVAGPQVMQRAAQINCLGHTYLEVERRQERLLGGWRLWGSAWGR